MSEEPSTLTIAEQSAPMLNEIGIEPGWKFDTMMRIDTHNFTDNLVCFILVIVMMLITILAAFIAGPHEVNTDTKIFSIQKDQNYFKTELLLNNNLSPYHRFVTLSIGFGRIEISSDILSSHILNISFDIDTKLVESPNKDSPWSIAHRSTSNEFKINFGKYMVESEKITLYFDKMLHHKNQQFHANIILCGQELKSFSYVEIGWKYGNITVTWVVLIVRSIYLALIISIFVVYSSLILLGKKKFRLWTTEQKMTYLLLFFCIFHNYPLFDVKIMELNLTIVTLNSILETTFKMLVPFYVIMIFQSVKCQCVPLDFPLKIILESVFFLISLIDVGASLAYCIDIYRTQIFLRETSDIRHISDICECSVSIVVLVVIIKTSLTLDETEFFRFLSYSAHTFLMFFGTLPIKMIRSKIEFTCLPALIEFTGYNLFVVVMSYFHWPYKFSTDTAYQDSTIQEPKLNIELDKATDEEAKFSDTSDSSEVGTESPTTENHEVEEEMSEKIESENPLESNIDP